MKLRTLLLVLLLGGSGTLAAQGASLDELAELGEGVELPEIRRYAVEIIVFRYAEDVGSGTEVFVPERIVDPDSLLGEDGLPLEGEIPDDSVAESPQSDDEIEEDPFPTPVETLTMIEDDYTLTATLERLERLDAYEPLMHFGWIQGMYPDQETPVQPLARFAAPPEGLDGTLHLYLSRYLHLVVDLALDAGDDAELPRQSAPMFGDPLLRSGFGDDYYDDEPRYAPLVYTIVEDRIMKNGETRYYDHPKFGVIAKIDRIEEDEFEDELQDSGAVVQ